MPVCIPLSRGQTAIIDDEDGDLSRHRWYAQKAKQATFTFYAARHSRADEGPKRIIYLHRVTGERMGIHGSGPDHKDRNGLNNTRTNLRPASRSQNLANRRRQSNNTTGFKGVSWDKSRGKYIVHAAVDKKQKFLGRFVSPVTAALAYDRTTLQMFGEYADVNFQPSPFTNAIISKSFLAHLAAAKTPANDTAPSLMTGTA